MDIDIRDHIVDVRFDKGQEIATTDDSVLGRNIDNKIISVSVSRDSARRVVGVKIKFVED